jgi:hypothetical protein
MGPTDRSWRNVRMEQREKDPGKRWEIKEEKKKRSNKRD